MSSNDKQNIVINTPPQVSVIMAVFNGEAFVQDAIDSILKQSFTAFELIIINDGSTDGTAAILDNQSDPRIRVVHQENRGLPRSLNRGIEIARGEYIARMDADDISLPERFAHQVTYLDSHPECGLIGTQTIVREYGDSSSRIVSITAWSQEHDILLVQSLWLCPCTHSSWMFRRAALRIVGLYSTEHRLEDLEFWLRMASHFKVSTINEPLIIYRKMSNESITATHGDKINNSLFLITQKRFHAFAGEKYSEEIARNLAACFLRPQDLSLRPNWPTMHRALNRIAQQLKSHYPRALKVIRLLFWGLTMKMLIYHYVPRSVAPRLISRIVNLRRFVLAIKPGMSR